MRRLLHIQFALLFYLSLLSRYRADSVEPPCFMVPSASCSDLKPEERCNVSASDQFTQQIYCCNVTHELELDRYFNTLSSPERILGFHMRDSSLEKLEMTIFNRLKNLASFSITGSNITHISGAFDGPCPLTCLNISQNMISEIHPYVLLKLKGLKNIVITNNKNVSVLPEFSKELRGFKLDVSGNFQLSCKYLINLTLADAEETLKFDQINRNSTVCSPPFGKLFTESAVVYVTMENLDTVREIVRDCPTINGTDKCKCSVTALDVGENNTFTYQALVNCSRRAMTSLPDKLPSATRILDISHNNIPSLDGIGSGRFNNVRELYADNNKIVTLTHLRGTKFLSQFQNLSLKNNKIDSVSVQLLSHMFDRFDGNRLLLAKNEFKCDCQTATHTKRWIIWYREHIPDYVDIITNCDSGKKKLTELEIKDVCSSSTDWKDLIRYVIGGEILIFVVLIAKVSYDFYIFKTFGYLPWPASKMPKLPCDWCFET